MWPSSAGWIRKTAWVLTWPIHLVFMCTIPDCDKPKFKKWFPITFLMCIIWIGSLSYVVAWMITIIGIIHCLDDFFSSNKSCIDDLANKNDDYVFVQGIH